VQALRADVDATSGERQRADAAAQSVADFHDGDGDPGGDQPAGCPDAGDAAPDDGHVGRGGAGHGWPSTLAGAIGPKPRRAALARVGGPWAADEILVLRGIYAVVSAICVRRTSIGVRVSESHTWGRPGRVASDHGTEV